MEDFHNKLGSRDNDERSIMKLLPAFALMSPHEHEFDALEPIINEMMSLSYIWYMDNYGNLSFIVIYL